MRGWSRRSAPGPPKSCARVSTRWPRQRARPPPRSNLRYPGATRAGSFPAVARWLPLPGVFPMFSSVVRDVRTALRALIKAPAFASVTLLTLAVSIGATTAIFSVVYAVLLRPLPYPDPDKIVTVAAVTFPDAGGGGTAPFSDRGFWHFVNNGKAWERFGGFTPNPIQWPLTGQGEPVQVDVALMTRNAYELIGTQPR